MADVQTLVLAPPQPAPSAPRLGRFSAYFGTPGNTLVSILSIAAIFFVAKLAFGWLVADAVFSGGGETCKAASGACWPFVAQKLRYMLFGFYPYDEQWRPMLALALLFGAFLFSMMPRFWSRGLLLAWILVVLPVLYILMAGGIFGLTPVATTSWGGLPLSFMLSFVGLTLAMPLGIVLALARASDLPAIRILAVGFIEIVRGVPLISILFMATVMLPLFMPEGVTIDKLLRAQVAIILFASAYIAEIVRGGLQDVPAGQYEAGSSLGLHYWQVMRKIVLPQA
ncbi:MAG: ABC transporter permease subunit, partial [Proteobacteria bacterium]|nr:ABC transporter permease subunit [Pseudomonadota bacterium]